MSPTSLLFVCLIISLTVWLVQRKTVQLQVGHLYCVCLISSLTVWLVQRKTVQLQVGHLYCVCLSDHLFDCVLSAKGNRTATNQTSLLCLFV